MQRRCCWPPERAPPGWVRRSRPHSRGPPARATARRARPCPRQPRRASLRPDSTLSRMFMAGKGLGFWKTMPIRMRISLGPRARRVDVLAVEVDLTCQRGARDQLVHAVEEPQEGGLAAARGPDERRDLACGHVQVDAFQHEVVAEPSARVDRFERGGPRRGAAVEVHAVRLAGHVGGGGVVQVDRGVRHGKVLRTGGRAWRSGAVRVCRGGGGRARSNGRGRRGRAPSSSAREPRWRRAGW